MNAFLNIDPYINLERQEAIDMIKTSLLINTPLIVQQKQNTLKLQWNSFNMMPMVSTHQHHYNQLMEMALHNGYQTLCKAPFFLI